jgi:hypothetical protein
MEGKAMMGRGSRSTVDRVKSSSADTGSTVGDRAAETVAELAERAADIATRAAEAAREARKTAEPVIRSAAEKAAERAGEAAREARKQAEPVIRNAAEKAAEQLSDVAERAAEVLADTAERLAQQSAEKGAEATVSAREKLADATEKLAQSVRPKKRRRGRKVLLFGAIAGGAAGIAMSPVGQKLRSMVSGGHQDPPEPQSITLPVQPQSSMNSGPVAASQGATASTTAKPAGDGNGVLAGRPVPPKLGEETAADS